MDASGAVDLARQTVTLMLLISLPVLVVGMTVGLLVSILQAVTQVQEQTLSFVPKIVAMLMTGALIAPWAMNKLLEYARQMLGTMP